MKGVAAPSITPEEFARIRAILERHAGLKIEPSRTQLVETRLASRLRRLGLTSFSDYCERVTSDPRELDFLLGALTTHVTSFFRERHHFEFLVGHCVPRWLRRSHRRVRIWSAGCSSGQEAYSIAMTLHDALPDSARWEVRIDGWDVDEGVITLARNGIYQRKDIEPLSVEQRRRHLFLGVGRRRGQHKIKQHLRDWTAFERRNLLGPWEAKEPYDAIFCRNVLIYFSRDKSVRLCQRFADSLAPGGHLFLGHSECLPEIRRFLQPAGLSVYARVDLAREAAV